MIEVGSFVGALDGDKEGLAEVDDGELDGVNEGYSDGGLVGNCVGSVVGGSVGNAVHLTFTLEIAIHSSGRFTSILKATLNGVFASMSSILSVVEYGIRLYRHL